MESKKEQERYLKVYSKYVDSGGRPWPPIIRPEIRLCGKWLEDIGFESGQTIKVKQEQHKITITLTRNTQNNIENK